MITFKELKIGDVRVYVDKKSTGLIKKLKDGGFHYWPGGLKKYADLQISGIQFTRSNYY